jgi:hypothetical protein
VTSGERWIRVRLADAPVALVEEMCRAVRSAAAEDDGVAEALAAAATHLYAAVAAGAGGREAALPLLAADALTTHALEASAQADSDAGAAFAAGWIEAGGRLGVLAQGYR